jgi:hypothetical protein
MPDIAKAIESNDITNGRLVIYYNNIIFLASSNIIPIDNTDIDLYNDRFDDPSYYFAAACASVDAGVIMFGWESGTRCLDATSAGCGGNPVGFAEPYQTYVYGDEVVLFEDNIWKYKNLSTLLAQSFNGPEYPWQANWPEPFEALQWCEPNQASEY